MTVDIFNKNLDSIRKKDSGLADRLINVVSNKKYTAIKVSKNGLPVPINANGMAFNSLYDPVKEAKAVIDSIKPLGFIFFAGIGGAYHISEYLERSTESLCIIAESDLETFRSLIDILDISSIISNPRVTLFPDCTDENILNTLPAFYIPALHGDFRLFALRTWQNHNSEVLKTVENTIRNTLNRISADISVQAHFGKLWLRNFFLNLPLAEHNQTQQPLFDTTKTALVLAAGPSLEENIREIKKNRDKYILITTDTAYHSLVDSRINADIFVSIDAQSVSLTHAMHPFNRKMLVVLEICGNPGIARRALESGASLLFVAGGHPLAQLAATFAPLPPVQTSSGTVAIAALDIAHSLGFTDIRVLGADFAYTHGKPYVRGTYLASKYGMSSNRFSTEELYYCALIFRTPVTCVSQDGGLTYLTETLNAYSNAYSQYVSAKIWNKCHFCLFPARSFIELYLGKIQNISYSIQSENPILKTLLPFISWYSAHKHTQQSHKNTIAAIQLALSLIAGYTKVL